MSEWTKEEEKVVYSGFRKIVRKTFASPDGREYQFDVKVEGDVVCVLPITEDGTVLLVRQFRPGPEKYLLELPGGHIDPSEEPFVAMEREFLEETGYEGAFQYLCPSISCPYSTRIKHNFLALDCKKAEDLDAQAHEQTEVVTMPLEEFRKRLQQGEFPESDTAFLALNLYDSLKR